MGAVPVGREAGGPGAGVVVFDLTGGGPGGGALVIVQGPENLLV